ncbi:MAG: type 4a pilus biogenesis protein PilO [Deltaproteobacteria bacterium]|jgi:type IV pilus assembly protein PilO|nr:MAG: type 4a pilus biogenesis protein PilO [Deltaproteobacteria bacterium]
MAVDLDAYFDKISKLRMLHRVLIFAGTVFLLIGLFAGLIYIPKTRDIATIKSNLDDLEVKIANARKKAGKKERLEAEHDKAQGDLRLALTLLPSTSEIPKLLKSITKAGNDSNLEFLLFSPEKEVPKEELYIEIPVSIQVKGGYHDVAMFFDKIGKMERIVNVVNVNIVPIKPNSTTLKTTCKALTYRFKERKKPEGERKKKK